MGQKRYAAEQITGKLRRPKATPGHTRSWGKNANEQ